MALRTKLNCVNFEFNIEVHHMYTVYKIPIEANISSVDRETPNTKHQLGI